MPDIDTAPAVPISVLFKDLVRALDSCGSHLTISRVEQPRNPMQPDAPVTFAYQVAFACSENLRIV